MQPLESTRIAEVEVISYARYVSEQRETDATEYLHDAVQKVLRSLPEQERTVIRLYYLSEMRVTEIGEFLGVSVNTIKSRLLRARRRLQQKRDSLLH